MIPKREGDKQYTAFFGLNETLRTVEKDKKKKVYRIFQIHRTSKPRLIRELYLFIDKLEEEQREE